MQTSKVIEQRVSLAHPAGEDTSPRRTELLEASYQYVLEHGLVDMSLRPLAAAVGSSPRVLLYLFGSKDDLVRALLARARQDELVLLNNLRTTHEATLRAAAEQLWDWLVAPEHLSLLRLWFEGYARSLEDTTGPWAGFARQTVDDWLHLLSGFQPAPWRNTDSAVAERTHVLAVLRGCLADLLATGDVSRTTAAVSRALAGKPAETRQSTKGRRDA